MKITGIEPVVIRVNQRGDDALRFGGAQINPNIMDAEQVLEAHKDPS